jgi:hypothetical protein
LVSAAATAGIVSVGVVIASAGSSSSSAEAPVTQALQGDAANVAVLSSSQRTSLPPGLAYGGLGVQDPSQAVALGEHGGGRYFAAAGTDGQVCLVAAESGPVSGTCSKFSNAAASQGILVPLVTWSGGEMKVAAIARDGITEAIVGGTTIPVQDNLFVATIPKGADKVEFVVKGQSGTTTVDFSGFRPPPGAVGAPG